MLDIGGGYPGIERELHLFEKIAHVVNTSIDELFSNRDDLKLIAEPGQLVHKLYVILKYCIRSVLFSVLFLIGCSSN